MSMKNIALIVRKDFLFATAASRVYLAVMIIVLSAITALSPNMITLVLVMIVYVLVINLFQNEENELVCNIRAVLPVNRKEPVIARYVYFYLVILVEFVLCFILNLIYSFFLKESFNIFPFINGICSALIMGSVCMPLLYRFGVLKMRMWLFFVYIVAIVGASVLGELLNPEKFAYVTESFLLIMLGLSIVVSFVSMLISLKIAKRSID